MSTLVLPMDSAGLPSANTVQHFATRAHEMPFGSMVQADGSVAFRIWAPDAEKMQLAFEGRADLIPMNSDGRGWHELCTFEASIGTLYSFVLEDGSRVPDPASRFQPQDVHGPSEVIAPGSYLWKDDTWAGRPWSETVLYELHIGTFTSEGTFAAAIMKLDHLRELGITAIEIMPVADFPGRWNWGYDGALLFAPDSSYGRPEDFKGFIEAAHKCGISVILDVVYNHFGPDGNYIHEYFKGIVTDRRKTAWGDAVNYDGTGSEHVRRFILHNALYWVEEFHLDGLRLDAVHAILDDSPRHILDELAERLRTAVTDRPMHLILENENNDVCRLLRDEKGRPACYTAQWNDDMHHVLHTAATHEKSGYYADYEGKTDLLGRAIAEGFAYQGEVSQCTGKPRGQLCRDLPPEVFISFLQNHDQIGNRAFGERLTRLVDERVKRALCAVYLLAPQIPMLFMGEEWNAHQPFPYFCDFAGELANRVRSGRRDEFADFPEYADPASREKIPDPQAESTFVSAKLDWENLQTASGQNWLTQYSQLLRIRNERIVPLVARLSKPKGCCSVLGPGAVHVVWKLEGGADLELHANLSSRPLECSLEWNGEQVWHEGYPLQDGKMEPWTVRWSVRS